MNREGNGWLNRGENGWMNKGGNGRTDGQMVEHRKMSNHRYGATRSLRMMIIQHIAS